ncbi:MAG: FAD-binding oxidoreductase [Candidatus Competibacterales bacterium]
MEAAESYHAKTQRLQRAMAEAKTQVRLAKDTSNLFRARKPTQGQRLTVKDFNRVLAVDPEALTVVTEGMAPYHAAVAAALPAGVMPAVVPELRSITVGGALAGVGIESSSFRHGLVHETALAFDVLLADGSVVTCTPDGDHADLFRGFANSYGTLGYALRVTLKAIPIKPFVRLQHLRHRCLESLLDDLQTHRESVDFIDGVVFAPDELYLTLGQFVDRAPYQSDYTFQHIYYRSIPRRREDYLTTADYLWRWDTDWFWCSKNVFAQQPLIRRLYGRRRLNSITYGKLMALNNRLGLTQRLAKLSGYYREGVIQDVDIPVANASNFLTFFHQQIGITPLWLCPTQPTQRRFDLFPMDPSTLYINFGFWDVVKSRESRTPGHYNRLIEDKVIELGGIKSLYSDAYYSPETFWQLYDHTAYQSLKARYDPQGRFLDLYQKTVLRQ